MATTQSTSVSPVPEHADALRRIRVHPPEVAGQDLLFRWTVEPASPLYRSSSFRLTFPQSVPLRDVPESLLWTIALLCLHPQWAFLRPCRVELPVELPPGEREFWLRLVDSAVATLEINRGTADFARTVEILDRGPRLEQPPPARDRGAVATAFSGGKDSLLQLGLLAELGEPTIAVTTTSPVQDLTEHSTARRRQVLDEVARRRDIEHVEVDSDLRSCWQNDIGGTLGYWISVSELTDTFLYLSSMLVVGWVRGAPRLFLASEAEVQETATRHGRVVQHPHFMYSAITQRALDALLRRSGMRYGSLTYPLRSGQVQRLLWTRYPGLRDLQYSCWRVPPDAATCSACSQCLRIALSALAVGGSPAEMGIDLPRLLVRMHDWSPSQPTDADLPDDRVKAALHAQVVRDLSEVSPLAVARRLVANAPRRLLARDTLKALRAYRGLRRRVLASAPVTAAPGYRAGYLELVDRRLRGPLADIYDESFPRAPIEEHADLLERTRSQSDWIAEPLGGTA